MRVLQGTAAVRGRRPPVSYLSASLSLSVHSCVLYTHPPPCVSEDAALPAIGYQLVNHQRDSRRRTIINRLRPGGKPLAVNDPRSRPIGDVWNLGGCSRM